ncbi:T9SS sorting signal type C domain-containing protein [Flavobacterium sp. CYK-4]|uniref:T9SS sorting signal type C domain-containing protein n=1 Tax=Flavobacterium lotistagni TaxID=2709660 RepID=UPI00140ACB04|nr:T9SS sorting signal type C domain-containing protein [Flavobacterium lotistagni]NHM07659.1 T9SS sorting signal type C domain-containing protein [Flavobacterium lotistagni]
MKTLLQKSSVVCLIMLICLVSNQQVLGQTNNYFGTSGTLSGSVWSTNPAGPYTSALVTTGGAIINFENATTSITGGAITVAGINATANATITSIGGTISNFSNGNVPVNVSSGVTLDFAGNAMTTSATASYTKNGSGAWALGGATWGGGFTLNGGTIVARGVNCMGSGGVLTINGGTIGANANRDLSGKYSNIVVGGDFTLGSPTSPAVTTANLTFSNTMALGTSTSRTITIGGTGTYTLGGVISGSGSNLTVASTAAGTIVLTGANTYNGTTTVSGGTLRLNRTGGTTLPTGNSVVVNSGATLTISTAQQLNNLTVDAGGTVILNATLTISGTATINGTLQIGQGGFATTTGGGSYTYGSNGTLAYNLTSGSYGPIDAGHVYWPASNGPANVRVTCTGTAAINLGVARTVPSSGTTGTFLLVSGTNAIQGTALTLNGDVQINGGNFQTTPTYGASSTLIYNTTYGTSNEWTGGASSSVSAGSGVPANVQVLTGTVTLAGGRGVPGNVTITGGGMTLNATSGDLYIGGNLTNNGTWTNNSRAVRFVGTGTSVVTASSGTQFFDYLLIEKTSGSVQIASATNVTINTTAGSVLQFLNAGTLDLNGRTLTLNNSGGNILADGTTGGTTKSIVSTSGTGTIAITNNKTASGSASGTLSTSSSVNWVLTSGMNFGGVTTINGALQLNSGGFVSTNAPTYGTGSTLIYNTGGTYGRNLEWSTTAGSGYPYNVQVQNGTTVDLSANGFADRAIAGNLNLGLDGAASAGSLSMGASTNKLTVGGNVVIGGNTSGTSVLTLSSAIGGDIYLTGNWDTKTNGSYISNTRAVFFEGAGTSTVTTIGAATFDYLFVNKTSGGTVSLANDMTVNNNLTLNAQLVTNAYKVIIPSGNNVTANTNGWVRGNLQKNIPTGTNSRTFEVGDATVYAPVTTAYSGVTGAGDITVSTTDNDHPQVSGSTIDAAKSVNRFYTIANSGVTGGSYDATFTFDAADVDGGANTNNFIISSYVNPTWTPVTVGTKTSTSTQATGLTGYGDFQIGELGSVTTTWTAGASTTTWTTSGNWSNGVPTSSTDVVISTASFYPEISTTETVKSLTLDSGTSLTILSGNNLTVDNLIDNDGTLTVENNANLKQNNTGTNTGSGTAVVKRNTATLMRQDYVMWSSPVDGQQLQAFSPQTLSTRFYTFDGSAGSAGQYVATSATGNFSTGVGYLIRLPNNHPATPTIWNGTFTGTGIHNGTYTQSSLTSGLYYAIGNPYPSTIDADLFIAGNSLTDALYFWRKTNNSANPSYATYTLAGGTGTPNGSDPLGLTPNGVINVGQGFIVKTASTSLQFTNGMRITNNGNLFFRRNEVERHRIWLDMSNSAGIFCQTLVAYMENATGGYDNMIDGRFLNDSDNALTSLINNEEFAIQGKGLPFDATDVVPLGFKVSTAGDYSIAINHVDGLFEDAAEGIYLKDNLTNTFHDLRTAPYTFASEAGVFNDRFELRYQNLLSVDNPAFSNGSVVVYKQNRELVISAAKQLISKVEIFDISGRLLAEKSGIKATEVRMNPGVASQVLLVKVTATNNEVITKKVMN